MEFYKNIIACTLAVTLSASPALGARQVSALQRAWTQSGKMAIPELTTIPSYPSASNSAASIFIPLNLELSSGWRPSLGEVLLKADLSEDGPDKGASFQAHKITLAQAHGFTPITPMEFALIQNFPQKETALAPVNLIGLDASNPETSTTSNTALRPKKSLGYLKTLAFRILGAAPKRALDHAFDFEKQAPGSEADGEFRNHPYYLVTNPRQDRRMELLPTASYMRPSPSQTMPLRSWEILASIALFAILAVTGHYSGWSILDPLSFTTLLGMAAAAWSKRFQARLSTPLRPGEAFHDSEFRSGKSLLPNVSDVKNRPLVQDGLKHGYLFKPNHPTHPYTYLYAVPEQIQGASELNRHFGSLIGEGIRHHTGGEFVTALAYFLAAQQYLDQEIEPTGFHKRAPDQRAYAANRRLTTLLLWNTIPDLFRDHMKRHSMGLLPKFQEAMDTLLDSSFLAVNKPVDAEFPDKVVENARSALNALALEMEARLTLPVELDKPERRQMLLETLRQFIAVMTGEADPENQATQRATIPNAKPLLPTLQDMLVLSAVRDRWVDPAQFSLDEIAQAALRALKGLPSSYDGEVARFERFLERALRYTYFPRRLMRVLLRALASSSSWEKSLLEPGPKYTEEVLWKLDVENLLADVIPQLIEALGKKLARRHPKADPNNIGGIFIVGGFTQHPALGNDPNTPASDFNYLVVTQGRDMGPAQVFSQYLRSLRTQYRTLEKLSDTTFHGTVLLGSRDFDRELELGSVFIDSKGQIQRADEEILDLGTKGSP